MTNTDYRKKAKSPYAAGNKQGNGTNFGNGQENFREMAIL